MKRFARPLALVAVGMALVVVPAAIGNDGDGDHGDTPEFGPAGEVASFENGKLAVDLTENGNIAGRVTDHTFIVCQTGDEGEGGDGESDKPRRNFGHGDDGWDRCGRDELTAGRTVLKAGMALFDGRAFFKFIALG